MLSKTLKKDFLNECKKNYLIEYLKENIIDFKIINRCKKEYQPFLNKKKSFININYNNYNKKSYENKKHTFKMCQTKLKNLYDFLKENNINYEYSQGETNENLSANISNLRVKCNIVIPIHKSITIFDKNEVIHKNNFLDNHYKKEVETF